MACSSSVPMLRPQHAVPKHLNNPARAKGPWSGLRLPPRAMNGTRRAPRQPAPARRGQTPATSPVLRCQPENKARRGTGSHGQNNSCRAVRMHLVHHQQNSVADVSLLHKMVSAPSQLDFRRSPRVLGSGLPRAAVAAIDGTHSRHFLAVLLVVGASAAQAGRPRGVPGPRYTPCFNLVFAADAPPHAICCHWPVLALASTASQTFCVCKAQRKSGCAGEPVSRPSRKSARALMKVCS